MSHRAWQSLSALILAAGVLSLGAIGLAGAAQRSLDGQLVAKSDGTLFLVQGGQKFLVQPLKLPDADVDAIPDGGQVDKLVGSVANAPGPALFPAAAQDASSAADLVFNQYWLLGQWEAAYALFHPDVQAALPRAPFLDGMRAWSSQFKVTAVQVGTLDMLDSWTDPYLNKTYSQVARVTVTLTIRNNGNEWQVPYPLHMVKVGDFWRWFWVPMGEAKE